MGVLIVLSTLAFVASEVVRVQVMPTAGVILLDVISALLSVIAIYVGIKQRTKTVKLSLAKPLGIFIIVCWVSLLLSPYAVHFVSSSLYLVRYLIYLSPYFLVSLLPKEKRRKIFPYLTGAGVTLVLIGFIQFFFYPNLRNLYYLGWDDHLYRLFSTFLDPNFAGMYFVLFLIFLFPNIRRAFTKKDRRSLILYSVLSGFTLLAVLLTYSRTAFIMLFAGLISYLLVYRKFKLLILSLMVSIVLIALTSNVKTEGLNPFRTASSLARIESTQQAITIIAKHPIFGVGFNAYQFALFDLGYRKEPTTANHALGGTDNSFLFVAATTGIVGFLAYLYLLYSMIKLARIRIKEKIFLADAVLASTIALSVGSLFINGLFYPMMLFWTWILYGLIEV